jgi:hypothetical protein
MDTPEPRLRFLVDFATRNLDGLAPDQWLRLRGQLEEFLAGGEQRPDTGVITAMGFEGPGPQECPEGLVRRLQVDVRALLERLVDQRESGRTGKLGQAPIVTLTRPPELWLLPVRGAVIGLVQRLPVDDAVRFMLWVLLGRGFSGNVRRCPESRCGRRLFYRVRRQVYCSERCRTRASQRKARGTVRGKEIEAKRKKRQYRRRIFGRRSL